MNYCSIDIKMFTCKSCEVKARDGVTCSLCEGQFDFPCAGITEIGWRKLGDRKSTWKCANCKSSATASPRIDSLKIPPADSQTILTELKRLSLQMEALPVLVETIKAIQTELVELKSIRSEFSEMKASMAFVSDDMNALTSKVSSLEQEIEAMKKTREEISVLQGRVVKLENQLCESDQRSRMNNIEIKGVPMTNDENLFTLMAKIGDVINCHIPKEHINYIARVPMRNDKQNKNIICSVHNSYMKNDFIAAAKKHKTLKTGDLGLRGENRIYVNDHLTFENKILLNKTKARAKERGFEHVWVRGCKIMLRKNDTSPKFHVKSEQDLNKFLY